MYYEYIEHMDQRVDSSESVQSNYQNTSYPIESFDSIVANMNFCNYPCH